MRRVRCTSCRPSASCGGSHAASADVMMVGWTPARTAAGTDTNHSKAVEQFMAESKRLTEQVAAERERIGQKYSALLKNLSGVKVERGKSVKVQARLAMTTQRTVSFLTLGTGGAAVVVAGLFGLGALSEEAAAKNLLQKRDKQGLDAGELNIAAGASTIQYLLPALVQAQDCVGARLGHHGALDLALDDEGAGELDVADHAHAFAHQSVDGAAAGRCRSCSLLLSEHHASPSMTTSFHMNSRSIVPPPSGSTRRRTDVGLKPSGSMSKPDSC